MSRQPVTDPWPHLHTVVRAAGAPGQPAPLFRALDGALAAVLGHRLFTILLHHDATGESERCYTNQPAVYPVGGRKALNPTPWAQRVIHGRRPYIGRSAEDIRTVFFDHELIASLGCASVLNLPVVWNDRLLGTLNLLHEAAWYGEEDVAPGLAFAALAVPGFLALAR